MQRVDKGVDKSDAYGGSFRVSVFSTATGKVKVGFPLTHKQKKAGCETHFWTYPQLEGLLITKRSIF
ncbi:MAG: hypothetical protein ACR2HF_04895 [Methylococcaceae bacterium]